MRLEDIAEVLDVWKSIGLHEGTCTIQSFMSVDPEGFIVAEDEETGKCFNAGEKSNSFNCNVSSINFLGAKYLFLFQVKY